MTVRRIVANIATDTLPEVRQFYADLFGLEVAMDHGWIVTLTSPETARVQLGIASEGGSGTPVPDLSIEVDNLDETLARARTLGHAIEYGPATEPWGVRRFFLRDPAGKLLNILAHDD
ncbi:VOC family protein [Oceaniglobus trochenteri]|uniref:VOC family protein n=1 Tax=Oceaniglobus trochenteri TaxID=2763260 RepID=UPI001CFFF303|nr:VOC family protein [Oceaniglobus trochenteri]